MADGTIYTYLTAYAIRNTRLPLLTHKCSTKGEGCKKAVFVANMNMFNQAGNQERLRQLQNDPLGMAKQAGYQIPENLANDPKGMVMHLINSGQVSNPMLQRIMPMMQMLGGK